MRDDLERANNRARNWSRYALQSWNEIICDL